MSRSKFILAFKLLKATLKSMRTQHFSVMSSGIAFYCFLGVFPFLSLCLGIYTQYFSFADFDSSLVMQWFPPSIVDFLLVQISSLATQKIYLSFQAIIALSLTLWSASSALQNLSQGLDIAYDLPMSTLKKRTLVSLVGTISFGFLLFLTFILTSLIPAVIELLRLETFSQILSQCLSFILIFSISTFSLSLAYQNIPNHKKKKPRLGEVLVGAACASFLILVSSFLLTFYVEKLATISSLYGALSGLIIFLIWLRLNILIILSGAKLNREIDKKNRNSKVPVDFNIEIEN